MRPYSDTSVDVHNRTRRWRDRKGPEDDGGGSPLAGTAARSLGTHPCDAAHVDPDRRQSTVGAEPVHEPLVASAALRDRARPYDVAHPYDGETFEILFDFIEHDLFI